MRLGSRANVGLGDDLEQRRSGAVQVDQAVAAAPRFVVKVLAGIFFEMGADDADPPRLGRLRVGRDLEPAVGAEGQIVLADLITLRQVGIVILLAVPLGERRESCS